MVSDDISKKNNVLSINDIRIAVNKIARQYPIKQVQLFGSYANGAATPDSDVDVLVIFKDRPITLLDFYGFQQELSDLHNTNVDVIRLPLSEYAINNMIFDKVVNLYG